MTKFTIFGHTGFIGSELKKILKKQKLVLPKRNQLILKENLGKVIYCIGSDNWKDDSFNSFKANLGYLPEIISKNKFDTFTFLSTTRVYKKSSSTKESASLKMNPLDNDDYYNLKKICAESFLYSQRKKFKIIRLSNIYGYNYKSPLVLPVFINNAIKIGKIFITINKNSSKDFLNVEDAIDMIIKITKKGKEEIYNVASGKNINLLKISKEIQKYTNCKIILKNQNKLVNEPKIDIKKIKKEFNFSPKSNLINDIGKLVAKFKLYGGHKL